jgi:phage protein D
MPMAEVINLRQARKQLSRAKKRAEASENAAKSGRTKAQKTLEAARAEKARADLDAHMRDKD